MPGSRPDGFLESLRMDDPAIIVPHSVTALKQATGDVPQFE
ncbi:MAG TPA: hypothetical protein VH308_02800 [Terracidiphilus sp.]|nr:hypothetical protein [Terracidiphilus sp.]